MWLIMRMTSDEAQNEDEFEDEHVVQLIDNISSCMQPLKQAGDQID